MGAYGSTRYADAPGSEADAQVIGNLHFSPGRSFQNNMLQIQELVPYLKDKNHHDFGHIINKFRFGADISPEAGASAFVREMATRTKLGIKDPLQAVAAHIEECKLRGVVYELS